MRKLVCVFVLILSVFSLTMMGCANGDKPTEVSIELPATLEMVVEQETTLTAVVKNSEATVSWSSSNPLVATVNNGKVNAYAVGETNITASVDGKEAVCVVTVSAKAATAELSVTMISNATIYVGHSLTLTPVVKLGDKVVTKDVSIEYISAKPTIVSVTSVGVLTGESQGTADVSVKCSYQNKTITKKCSVTVSIIEDITFAKQNINTTIGAETTLEALINDAVAENSQFTWKSSDLAVATVNSVGKVSPLAKGTTTITCDKEGNNASIQITVYSAFISNLAEFKNINNDLSGWYLLTSDINLENNRTSVVGKTFHGLLDGNGNAIKNINFCIFNAVAADAELRNLALVDATIGNDTTVDMEADVDDRGIMGIGVLASRFHGTASDIYAEITMTADGLDENKAPGGFAGFSKGIFNNCVVNINYTANTFDNAGALFGNNWDTSKCHVNNTIVISNGPTDMDARFGDNGANTVLSNSKVYPTISAANTGITNKEIDCSSFGSEYWTKNINLPVFKGAPSITNNVTSAELSLTGTTKPSTLQLMPVVKVNYTIVDNPTLQYKISTPACVLVSSTGLVTATAEGTSVISIVYTQNSVEYKVDVTIVVSNALAIDKLETNKSKLANHDGYKTANLTAKSSDNQIIDNSLVEWSSSDNTIASVANGIVTSGAKGGKVTITATYLNISKAIDITVYDAIIANNDNFKAIVAESGKYYLVVSDLTLVAAQDDTSVNKIIFTGCFDGNGHKITMGSAGEGGTRSKRMFQQIGVAGDTTTVVKNIKFDVYNVCQFGGALAGVIMGGTVENITGKIGLFFTSQASTMDGEGWNSAGGLIVAGKGGVIKDCSYTVEIPDYIQDTLPNAAGVERISAICVKYDDSLKIQNCHIKSNKTILLCKDSNETHVTNSEVTVQV